MCPEVYFVGVDVGTGSVRAALVDSKGKILKTAVCPIEIFNPLGDYYEQSSDNIWNSCVTCIKKVVADLEPAAIKGIGFDATCSLVVLDPAGNPLTVSPTGNNAQNVILWMDHRASKETKKINEFNHRVLRYVGGKISLEMETPKLLWLKTNLRKQCWDKAGYFFDLPDFLTWKATGEDSRSSCSLVCKWTYEINSNLNASWNRSYFEEIGLGDLLEDNCAKIGSKVLAPGSPIGKGLQESVAGELGLKPGTPVGTSLIDAHAGGLALIGCSAENVPEGFHTRLALICGTSTCHMAISSNPTFVPGIWGPYFNAMVPEMWLNEGGQSATGKLIDHVIESHPATGIIKNKIGDVHIQHYLTNLLNELRQKKNLSDVALLTEDFHIWPDFHGNRSPVADSTLKGMICGLTLSTDEDNLALLYLSTIQALSYGTRHILETLIKSGYSSIQSIGICGGLNKNKLFTQTQADVVNLPIVCPEESESVLLGSAILGACAAGYFSGVRTAIAEMGGKGSTVLPNKETKQFHDKKYKVFLQMLQDQKKYRDIMAS